MNLPTHTADNRITETHTTFKTFLLSKFHSQFATGVCWALLGTIAARGGTLLASLFLARMLGRTSFGELGVLESSVAMFAIFGNLGLSLTATKFVAKYHGTDPAKAGRILGLCLMFALGTGICAAITLFVLAPYLANNSLAAPHLLSYLRWSAGILVFSAINGTLTGALAGFQEFKSIAKVNLITASISLPLLTGTAYLFGIQGVVCSLVCTQGIYYLLYVITLRRIVVKYQTHLSFRRCWEERWVLSNFSLPALLNASMRSPVNWICIALLVNTVNGYSEMGILNAVNVWFLTLLFLPGQLSQVYFPILERALAEGNTVEAQKLLWKTVGLNALVCFAVAICITLFADTILLGYGPEYLDAKPVLILAVWTATLTAIQQPFAVFLVAQSKMWLVANCSIAWALVTLTVSYALLDRGAMGITAARFCGYFLYAILSVWFATRLLKTSVSKHHADQQFQPDQQDSVTPQAA